MKESSINRVSAPSEGEIKNIQESVKKTYRSQENTILETERPKSGEELDVIQFLDQETNKLARDYGGEELRVPENVVHIIGEDEYAKICPKGSDASYLEDRQAIIVEDKNLNLIKFTNVLAHEMLHLKSYQSVRKWGETDNETLISQRRVGLGIKQRKEAGKYAFVDLNEAMTEYLMSRMVRQWNSNK